MRFSSFLFLLLHFLNPFFCSLQNSSISKMMHAFWCVECDLNRCFAKLPYVPVYRKIPSSENLQKRIRILLVVQTIQIAKLATPASINLCSKIKKMFDLRSGVAFILLWMFALLFSSFFQSHACLRNNRPLHNLQPKSFCSRDKLTIILQTKFVHVSSAVVDTIISKFSHC